MLKNTGHDITVDPLGRDLVTIGGGPLSYNYSVAHIKLHFGALDTIGSEHTVNGTPFPAEVISAFWLIRLLTMLFRNNTPFQVCCEYMKGQSDGVRFYSWLH